MATESQAPDAVVSSSGLDTSGGVTDIQDDPDSPDANWFTSNASDGSLRVSFPTPSGAPTTGADVQEFRVLLRKDASGGGTPDYSAELRETSGGAALQTLATNASVSSTSGQVESLTWDASNLGTADGSEVELLLTLNRGGGGPNERNVEVGAVEWNVDYQSGVTVEAGTASLTLSTHAASVSVGTTVAAGTAALTLTTFAADVSVGTTIAADTESLSLTTFAASVSVGTSVAAGTASLSLATHAADVSVGTSVAAGTANLTLTTYAADVSVGAGVTVSASTASLTLSTHAADVSVGTTVAAGTVTLSLSTHAASVSVGTTVAAAAASLSLTTHNATVTVTSEEDEVKCVRSRSYANPGQRAIRGYRSYS